MRLTGRNLDADGITYELVTGGVVVAAGGNEEREHGQEREPLDSLQIAQRQKIQEVDNPGNE